MTIITEGDGRLTALNADATESGGKAFANELIRLVSDTRDAMAQPRYRVPHREFREELRRINDAADELEVALSSLSDYGRAISKTCDPNLLERTGTTLHLLRRATAQAAELTPPRRPPSLIRGDFLHTLHALFSRHNVKFTATATRNESTGREYVSLAARAVSLALSIGDRAASEAVRTTSKKLGRIPG